jgi:uncharacterized protein (TIGR00730 family)
MPLDGNGRARSGGSRFAMTDRDVGQAQGEPQRFARVCVFCGSSAGVDPRFSASAGVLGTLLAERGISLVYGGGAVGMMGAVADAALAAGGEVIGVIPQGLWRREVGHPKVRDMRVVGTMHERKAAFAELADAFVALPGGLGTLEELFEIWTWSQLGIHRKPCGLLNAAGYFDDLLAFLDHAVSTGFIRETYRSMLVVEESPARLLEALASYRPPRVTQWMDEAES